MNRLRLAIDLDDVIVLSGQYMVDRYNAKHGTKLDLSFVNTHPIKDNWHAPNEDTAGKRLDEIRLSRGFRELRPTDEAIWGLNQIEPEYELFLMTGRSSNLVLPTQRWVQRNLPGIFSGVFFAEHYVEGGKISQVTKAKICADLAIDGLIDDLPSFALPTAESGTPVLLFGDYPWNSHVRLLQNMRRAKDWGAVVRELL